MRNESTSGNVCTAESPPLLCACRARASPTFIFFPLHRPQPCCRECVPDPFEQPSQHQKRSAAPVRDRGSPEEPDLWSETRKSGSTLSSRRIPLDTSSLICQQYSPPNIKYHRANSQKKIRGTSDWKKKKKEKRAQGGRFGPPSPGAFKQTNLSRPVSGDPLIFYYSPPLSPLAPCPYHESHAPPHYKIMVAHSKRVRSESCVNPLQDLSPAPELMRGQHALTYGHVVDGARSDNTTQIYFTSYL
ncbi:hypothetical protein EVAR_13160_1 [Eumeta japonica]|uniref:Uncharacterized protein n=1 Tax=Eumeta variegata TaxID=151549 RepID=A0A4C1U9Z8_EUMVA|nr:hypothetical protein EVAR_13160_1 [Eumeta japonica]